MINTSSHVKKNTEKSLSARNHTYYDVLKDAGISMGEFTLQNHKSTHDQPNNFLDGFHTKRYENGDIYSGYFINN